MKMKLKTKILSLVILAFAHPSWAKTKGETLCDAVILGHLDQIDLILSEQPELATFQDENGKSLMHLAIEFYHDGVVDRLIKHKVSAKTPNQNQETPIQRAAFFGLNKVILSLLDAGADWNSLSKDLQTEFAKFPNIKERIAQNNKKAAEPRARKGEKTLVELPGFHLTLTGFQSNKNH